MSLEVQVHIAEWSSSVARRAHNPEVAGSNPVSATKSVTVVDTISATVIFYFPPSEEWILRKAGLFPNISGHRRDVRPNLLRPWWENPGLSKTAIVIRVETINDYYPYRNPPKATVLRCTFGGGSDNAKRHMLSKRQLLVEINFQVCYYSKNR